MPAHSTSWWRLVRFIAKEDGQEYFGQPVDDYQDIGVAYANSDLIQVNVVFGHPLKQAAPLSGAIKTVSVLLTPLSAADIRTVRALGANFVQPGQNPFDAVKKRASVPILFYKPLNSITGPSTEIIIPPCAATETDYEVELVVILAKDIKDASPEQAKDAILGYTLSNDVSARKRMFATPQWGCGKSFDTFLPLGPTIVSASNAKGIHNPDNVHLTTKLNNRIMQEGNTSDMLWKTAETIAELSKGTTLEAGSIISMGTPPGEGFKRNPPVCLQNGDVCHLWGSNGLGSLINPVRSQQASDSVPLKARL
ncbi:hypothetical protein BCV70DRAFT_200717 [Testicularia cyperi]|uniref:Fumarylacetoacetase-like C-terminal domain-containing protein n=1 Tax=Testicularia cyperi TaxID=1882483 RepID=A0A317XPK9_9BASI|nr:hypothetical protein BCV70DRAFT_200717 [Testicularia cyperi]